MEATMDYVHQVLANITLWIGALGDVNTYVDAWIWFYGPLLGLLAGRFIGRKLTAPMRARREERDVASYAETAELYATARSRTILGR